MREQSFNTCGEETGKIWSVIMEGSQRLFLIGVEHVEALEFYIFIITQIVYVIVTFKSNISSLIGAHIAHNMHTYTF